MPSIPCPIKKCGWSTDDVADVCAATLLNAHMFNHISALHGQSADQTTMKTEKVKRPKTAADCVSEVWDYFSDLWVDSKAATKVEGQEVGDGGDQVAGNSGDGGEQFASNICDGSGQGTGNIGDSGGQIDGNVSDSGSEADYCQKSVICTNVAKRGCERVSQPEKWLKTIAKKKRNLGQSYTSYNTKIEVPARKVGKPCSDGCFDKVDRETISDIFSHFWNIGNYDDQNSYLQSLICEKEPKRRRKKVGESRRPVNYEYHVKVQHKNVKVCRSAFASIHGLGMGKMKLLLKKRTLSPSGTPLLDKRGRMPSPRAIGGRKLELVHEFIQGLLVTASHYTDASTPDRCYLDGVRSITELYKKYINWLDKNHNQEYKVSNQFWSKVFNRDYKIDLKPPKTE
ncbi:unnamed protein product [Meganyctiphanes norvegica]|uniref:Uncharacterized protein n=1 Tax=Meganyctiphanes norvegica TaxID=48144 RepID=A0AAV2RGG0_MEGNR